MPHELPIGLSGYLAADTTKRTQCAEFLCKNRRAVGALDEVVRRTRERTEKVGTPVR